MFFALINAIVILNVSYSISSINLKYPTFLFFCFMTDPAPQTVTKALHEIISLNAQCMTDHEL